MTTRAELLEEQMRMAEELLFSGQPLPSFAKALFLGLFDAKRVFPFPWPSNEERERAETFCKDLNAFMDKNLDADWIDRNAKFPPDLIKGLGDLGVLGCTLPESYGGLGISQYGYCRMVEEVARRCGATALFINAHQSIGLKALLLFGTKEQQDRWMPGIAKGDYLAAFALTEPNAGSDAAGVETRAVYDPVKKVYRINGQKQWITNGSIAHILTVMAKVEMDTPRGKEDKITAFLVTPDMPGFKVTAHALEKVGMRGSTTAKLAFEDMEVPEENILGPKGGGLKVALTVLDFGRTTFGATCTGSAKELLERAIKHAKARHQFKRPLASFGLVKQKISTMSALVYAMDSTTLLTAGLLDRGEEDFMLETAILKVLASDFQWRVLYDTMQILGGRSFFTDEPYERMMRDARLNMIGEGSNEVLRAFIGVVGLRDIAMQLKQISEVGKNPLTGIASAFGFGKKTIEGLLRTPIVPIDAPELQDEASKLGSAVRSLGLAVPRLLAQHKEGIIEQQMILDRLSTIAMAIYSTTAVLSRIDTALASKNGKRKDLDNELATAKLYCAMAFETIDTAHHGLFNNNDAAFMKLSEQITGIE
jgi:acyl-CoA dehydrogenase family protein 9